MLNNILKNITLKNVIFKPYQSREELNLSLNVIDLHFVSLKPRLENFIYPSKIYGILAVGRPILFVGDPNGEISKFIKENKCGIFIENGDYKLSVNCIMELCKNNIKAKQMGQSGRRLFIQKYDFKIAANKFNNLFMQI